MPVVCAVYNYTNQTGRDKKSFFRIPTVINKSDVKTKEISEKRRRLWFAAIARDDLACKDTQYMRVCSDHFVQALYNQSHPDWIPNQKLGYGTGDQSQWDHGERYFRLQERKEKQRKHQHYANTDGEASTPIIHLNFELQEGTAPSLLVDDSSVNNDSDDNETEDSLESCLEENRKLKIENENLKTENKMLKFFFHKIKSSKPEVLDGDDDKVRYYTGLPSFVTLMALFSFISSEIHCPKNSSLTKFQKLIVTLMRLRLNLPVVDLSYRLGVCKSTISRAFNKIINVLYVSLQPLIFWPERERI